MILNPQKTKELRINFARKISPVEALKMNGENIKTVLSAKLLGVTSDLSWDIHVTNITSKASQRLYFLRLLNRANIPMDKLVQVYCSLICLVKKHTFISGGQKFTPLKCLE